MQNNAQLSRFYNRKTQFISLRLIEFNLNKPRHLFRSGLLGGIWETETLLLD